MKIFVRILLIIVAIFVAYVILGHLYFSGAFDAPPARDEVVSNELLFSDGVTKAYVLKEESKLVMSFGDVDNRGVDYNLVVLRAGEDPIKKRLERTKYSGRDDQQKERAQSITFNLKWKAQDTLIECDNLASRSRLSSRFEKENPEVIRVLESYLISEGSYHNATDIETAELNPKIKRRLLECGFKEQDLSSYQYKYILEKERVMGHLSGRDDNMQRKAFQSEHELLVNFDKNVILVVESGDIKNIISAGPVIIVDDIIIVSMRFIGTSEWAFIYEGGAIDPKYLLHSNRYLEFSNKRLECQELYIHKYLYQRYSQKEWDKLDFKVISVPEK